MREGRSCHARVSALARASLLVGAGLLVAASLPDLGCSSSPRKTALFRRVKVGDLPARGLTFGGVFMDCNGDGWLDLLMSRHGNSAEIYLNRGNLRFERSLADTMQPPGLQDQHGAAACDFDRDGYWDVYITLGADRGLELAWNQLWRQQPAGRFVNVATDDPLLGDPVGRGRGALWADFNADHWPDLLVMNYQSQARLFLQSPRGWIDGTKWFPSLPSVPLWSAGMPPPAAEERARSTWIHSAAVADFDQDGWIDLLALGRPGLCGLWRNSGRGHFQDVTSPWGFDTALWPDVPSHGCVGDVDEDGDLDLVLLYRSRQQDVRNIQDRIELWLAEHDAYGPIFKHATAEAGLSGAQSVEAGLLVDLDNDGHLDLFALQNEISGAPARDLVFLGDGHGHFHEPPDGWGEDAPPRGRAESACAVDLDRDGDLDLVICNGGGIDRSAGAGMSLYENRSSQRLGVTLELASNVGPPHGLGARVELFLPGRTLVREVTSVAYPLSSSVLPLHFGVGEQPGPFRIAIHWASGQVEQALLPAAGAAYRLEEGSAELTRLAPRP